MVRFDRAFEMREETKLILALGNSRLRAVHASMETPRLRFLPLQILTPGTEPQRL